LRIDGMGTLDGRPHRRQKNILDRVFQIKVDSSVYEACEEALTDE
jgi:hypothetical protein